jgi:hypothetical protein
VKRSIAAFFAGLIAWVLVVSLLNRVLRLTIEGYAAAEPKMAFTLGMMLARLGIGAATSVIAGAVTGWISRSSARASWVLGLVILALFIPSHIMLWHSFPVWYHLTFLVTLVPLVMIGSRLARARGRRDLSNQPVRHLGLD